MPIPGVLIKMTEFLIGDRLRVRDKKDGKVYRAKVSALKPDKVRVHFVGWKANRDEWLCFHDERIVGRCDARGNLLSQVGDLPLDVSPDGPREEMDQRASVPGPSRHSLPSPAGVREDASSGSPVSTRDAGPETERSGNLGLTGGSGEVRSAAAVVASGCSLCGQVLLSQSVSCGDCGSMFHPDTLCLGVDHGVIDVLLADTQGAVKYVCCGCRVGRGGSSGGQGAFTQLLNIVGSLVGEVKDLTRKFSSIGGGSIDANPNIVPQGVSLAGEGHHGQSGQSIMGEMRELYEREKRKSSIILRGVGDVSVEEVERLFADICAYLEVDGVELVDVVKVANSVYRGKILNSSQRNCIFAETPRLRSSTQFRDTYVQRDLTYRQRMDVLAKRNSRRVNSQGVLSSSQLADESRGVDIQEVNAPARYSRSADGAGVSRVGRGSGVSGGGVSEVSRGGGESGVSRGRGGRGVGVSRGGRGVLSRGAGGSGVARGGRGSGMSRGVRGSGVTRGAGGSVVSRGGGGLIPSRGDPAL